MTRIMNFLNAETDGLPRWVIVALMFASAVLFLTCAQAGLTRQAKAYAAEYRITGEL